MAHSFNFVGGALALDLANTVAWRMGPRAIDRIAEPAAAAHWAAAAGIVGEGTAPPITAAQLDELRDLRSDIQAVFPVDAANVAALDRILAAYRAALGRQQLVVQGQCARLTPRPEIGLFEHIHGAVALSAFALLTSPDSAAVRVCGNLDCGWLFIDRSKNGRRQWCSGPGCGNAARVRQHRAMRRAADRASGS